MTKYRKNWNSNKKVEHIGDLLEKYLAVSGLGDAMKDISVIEAWGDIVGERVAGVTECVSLEDGVLSVRVKSAAWRQELAYMKGDLIKAIIRDRGPGLVRDIRFL